VKRFDWNEVKNAFLKTERDISFEEVQAAIEEGQALADVDHPLKKKYPNQKVFIVKYGDYVYVVPYIEDDEKIFLKTIYPSRKMAKKYLGKGRKQR